MEWRTSIFMRDGGEGDQGRRGIPNLGRADGRPCVRAKAGCQRPAARRSIEVEEERGLGRVLAETNMRWMRRGTDSSCFSFTMERKGQPEMERKAQPASPT